jgi:hypothetical protein
MDISNGSIYYWLTILILPHQPLAVFVRTMNILATNKKTKTMAIDISCLKYVGRERVGDPNDYKRKPTVLYRMKNNTV